MPALLAPVRPGTGFVRVLVNAPKSRPIEKVVSAALSSEIKGERLKILYAEPVNGKGPAGEIISDDLTIACGEGALRVLKVQRAGGKAMAAQELLKGFALPKGARFS